MSDQFKNLADRASEWFLSEDGKFWCLEDVIYTEKALVPMFQKLSIYLPKAYMTAPGQVNPEGTAGDFSAASAPIVFENNSAGYMQMPNAWLYGPRFYGVPYLEAGMVYITCGNRGSESRDAEGKLCGKSPANLVDLKTAIRFLRHNRAALPGDFSHIISVGWSAGGAMSTLLGSTGDSPLYEEYLKENGAYMDESDAVFASQCYCPIIDLEHADLAYEWMFHEDKTSENSPAGPAETMTPFKDALSQKLKEKYIAYFNGMNLKDEKGNPLTFGEDGRSGSAYEYLMNKLEESAGTFLKKLDDGGFDRAGVPFHYTAADYLSGNYTIPVELRPDADGPDKKDPDKKDPDKKSPDKKGSDGAEHFAGPGAAVDKRPPMPPAQYFCPNGQPEFSLGFMMLRPPKDAPAPAFNPKTIQIPGTPAEGWLTWDGEKAGLKSLDDYIMNHRRRMKGCTSFDILNMSSGENRLFGDTSQSYKHFCRKITEAIAELKDDYPEEYAKYYPEYENAGLSEEQKKAMYLCNPFSFIGTDEPKTMAKYFRIRVGAQDADTSFSVAMTAALKLQNAGIPTDYALIWDMPHSEADYDGQVQTWICDIVRK